MNEPDKAKGFLDKRDNVDRLWRWFVIGCALVAAFDLLALIEVLYHRHMSLFVEGLPGFYSAWGFAGIALLIFLAKLLRRIVMRPEDYYDGD